jgi:hypothetical protein
LQALDFVPLCGFFSGVAIFAFFRMFLENACEIRGILRGKCAQNRGESVVENTIEIGREKHATF